MLWYEKYIWIVNYWYLKKKRPICYNFSFSFVFVFYENSLAVKLETLSVQRYPDLRVGIVFVLEVPVGRDRVGPFLNRSLSRFLSQVTSSCLHRWWSRSNSQLVSCCIHRKWKHQWKKKRDWQLTCNVKIQRQSDFVHRNEPLFCGNLRQLYLWQADVNSIYQSGFNLGLNLYWCKCRIRDLK